MQAASLKQVEQLGPVDQIGVVLDLEACAAHPFRTPMPLPTLWREDGAVADW